MCDDCLRFRRAEEKRRAIYEKRKNDWGPPELTNGKGLGIDTDQKFRSRDESHRLLLEFWHKDVEEQGLQTVSKKQAGTPMLLYTQRRKKYLDQTPAQTSSNPSLKPLPIGTQIGKLGSAADAKKAFNTAL